MNPFLLFAGILLGAVTLVVFLRPPPPHPERDSGHELAQLHHEIASLRRSIEDMGGHPAPPDDGPRPDRDDRHDRHPGGPPPPPESVQTALIGEAGLDATKSAKVAALMTTQREKIGAARDAHRAQERAAMQALHTEFTGSLATVLAPGEIQQVLGWMDRHHPSGPEDRSGLPLGRPDRHPDRRPDSPPPPRDF